MKQTRRAMVLAESDKVTLTKKMQMLKRAQARLAGMALDGTKLASDELIEDRKVEVHPAAGVRRTALDAPAAS